MKYPNTYCVYDLETTGLDPHRDEAIEIGALIIRNGQPGPLRTWLIRPSTALSQATIDITGITQAEVDEKGRPPKECWKEFLDLAKGFPLVGHNISRFDNLFIAAAIAKYSISSAEFSLPMPSANPIARHGFVDTAALCKAAILNEDQLWSENHMQFAERVLSIKAFGVRYKLVDMFKEHGGDPESVQAHRVAGDMAMTNHIYRKITGLPEPTPQQKALL